MKNTIKVIVALVLVVSIFAFASCSATPKQEVAAVIGDEVSEQGMLSGELTLGGSTSVEKIAIALGDEFMALNPDVNFTYDSTGSSAGVKAAGEKLVMIGAASRNIKDKEKEAFKLDEQVLAFDGIAVVVNTANKAISEITMEQVQAIYKGEITNWSKIGGNDAPIIVITREDGSGTRGAFEEIVDFEDVLTATATIGDGNGGVKTAVESNKNAIGYISFVTLKEATEAGDAVKALLVNGVEATEANVVAGTYPIARPFNLVFFASELPQTAKAYLAFVQSAEGIAIIMEKGGIPVQ